MTPSTCHPRESGDLAAQHSNRYQALTKITHRILYKMGFEPFKLTPFCTKQAAL
jgi:hypothetical protein